jgi:hypothetical protein
VSVDTPDPPCVRHCTMLYFSWRRLKKYIYFKYFCGTLNLSSQYPRVPRHPGWEPLIYTMKCYYWIASSHKPTTTNYILLSIVLIVNIFYTDCTNKNKYDKKKINILCSLMEWAWQNIRQCQVWNSIFVGGFGNFFIIFLNYLKNLNSPFKILAKH